VHRSYSFDRLLHTMSVFKSFFGTKEGGNGAKGVEHQNKRVKADSNEDDQSPSLVPIKVEKETVLTLVVMPSDVEAALEPIDQTTPIPHEAAKQALQLFRDQQKVIQDGRAAYDNLYNEYSYMYQNLEDCQEMMRECNSEVVSLEEREMKWISKVGKAAKAMKQLAKEIHVIKANVCLATSFEDFEIMAEMGEGPGSSSEMKENMAAGQALDRALKILKALGIV
jgi:hypothetical protein